MLSSTFHVILRKFGLLFGQCTRCSLNVNKCIFHTGLCTMAEILWSLTLPSFYGGNLTCKTMKFLQLLGPYLRNRLQNSNTIHCPNSYQNFRDITWNIEENEILHEIFHVVSRFPRYILCYISENGLHLGQCRRIG